MSEIIEYPAMLPLSTLLNSAALGIYCAGELGQFTIDKDNKTITLNSTYTYDDAEIQKWQDTLSQAIANYNADLPAGVEIANNDDQLFMNVQEMIDKIKALT